MAESRTRIILDAEDRTRAAFASAKAGLKGVGAAAYTTQRVLGAFGVALSAVSIGALVRNAHNAAAAMGDLSTRTGVSVRDLAGLSLVAKQSDTSLEAMGRSLNRLGIFMTENAGEAKKLGLTAKEPLAAFVQLSGVLSQITDVQLRNTIANKALGRSYEEMLPALMKGPELLQRQIEQGQRYNKINQQMAEDAARFNDQLNLLGVQLTSVAGTVAGPFVSSLGKLIEKFREAREAGEGFWESLRRGLHGDDELGAIERRLEALGRSRSVLEGAADRPFLTERQRQKFREAQKQTEADIRTATERMEKLMHEQFVFKPPTPAPAETPTLDRITGDGGARAKTNAEFVKRLQEQVATMGLGEEAAERYKISLMGLSAAQLDAANSALSQKFAYEEGMQHFKDGLAAEEKATAAAQALSASLKDQARAIAENLDPQRALNNALALYGEQLAKNAITQEEYNLLFDDSIGRMVESTKNASEEMSEFARQAARNMQDTFADFLFDPFDKGVKGMAAGFIDSMRRMVAEAGAAKIFDSIGGNSLVSSFFGLFNEKGNAFNQAGVMPFARGGVVNSPTLFPFARGVGLMGEAGPEAIMPLKRGADGKLGVAASGGGDVIHITLNISTGVSQTVRAEIMNLMPTIKGEVMNAVVDAKRRGGSFGSAFS